MENIRNVDLLSYKRTMSRNRINEEKRKERGKEGKRKRDWINEKKITFPRVLY